MLLNIIGTKKTRNEFDYVNQKFDGFPCAGLVLENLDSDFAVLQNCPEMQSSMKISFVEYGLKSIYYIYINIRTRTKIKIIELELKKCLSTRCQRLNY